ncbi:Hypothetical predicted protein, partial [Paramuricea clavata]
DFYKDANKDDFWEFSLQESSVTSSLREPAHIFLQLVRDLFGTIDFGAKVGQIYLADLPDINFLKPVVWAEHKDKPECCGVSLGVRKFVRPLFLYIKLTQLRNLENGHNGVDLKDVKAYESALKRKYLLKPEAPSNKKSEYNNEKAPCQSCLVFFGRYKLTLNKLKEPPSFLPFGNCAEYDVIRTNNLNSVLLDLKQNTQHWALFESACEHHFQAFNQLTTILEEGGDPSERIKLYYKNTSEAKILKYQMFGLKFNPQFSLVAKNWRPNKRQAKRRKTVA